MKTEIKTERRASRRGTVLDIAILLLLIAILVAIGYRYYRASHTTGEDAPDAVWITFEVKGALPAISETLKDGDLLYLGGTGELLGELRTHDSATSPSPFSVSPAQLSLQDESGNYVNVSTPADNDAHGRQDLTGLLRATGVIGEDGSFSLGGHTTITPGQTIQVYTETATFTLTVFSVSSAAR